MTKSDRYKLPVDTRRFIVLNPRPPFLDEILKLVEIDQAEFAQIKALASGWQNDPRLIEMVRLAGDGSAKVPYLLDKGETAHTILDTLRDIAAPHVKHLESLPEAVQATIHLLLSLNTLPKGCEAYAIPALLEIDRMHANMVQVLHELMSDRPMARQFYNDNLAALQDLDRHWPGLIKQVAYPIPDVIVPKESQMSFEPVYKKNRLLHVYETCVVVPPPDRELLMQYTPRVLQRPLPAGMDAPATGTVDWMLREVGKIGRHFTRAMLYMVKERLEKEKISLEVRNYHLIQQQALLLWKDFVESLP